MTRRDHYYNKAKQEGYRSRAAYKLLQIDAAESIITEGDAVVDLGAAPGGWLQVAAAAVGESGRIVGVDIQPIDPLDDVEASVSLVRGDLTAEETRDAIRRHLPGGRADVVISDMAPEMTGEYSVDQARSVSLAEQALETALVLLRSGGHVVIKVFEGADVGALRRRMEDSFEYVAATSPDASRAASSELYLIGKRRIDPPVTVGDRLTIEIVDTGREGDGIARVDGFTLFVPDTRVGETVEVVVDDVKSSYGFATRRR